ncbi:MAG: hypothetical protein PQJ61_16530 [Spirochaetales bacterium]|uniref:LPP20 lipoprotein n=1 Tax=Candidatus Thalassospirochaeta sargassi TaxID=3119039 RepID=A0AAJ1IJW6_9SPIO|nr:hypothetical protein [Spirochaetales bacterium]
MKKGLLMLIILAAVFYSSCSTTPEQQRPEWTVSPPADNAEYTYFLGIGSASSGDEGAASAEAESLIISDITKYLGVRVTSDTTTTARDAYGKFESGIESAVREKSSARISGLRLIERWVEQVESGVTVYILAEYDTAELKAEKIRLTELFKEKQEAVSVPEKEGDSLALEKQHYRASVAYINAALAASSSDLENADLKFERNITKARESIEKLSVEAVSGPVSTYVGEGFNQDFIVRILSDGNPVEGLPVTINYKELLENGRKTVRTQTVLTGVDGLASMRPPAPGWVGSEKITFFLDLRAVIEPLEEVSFKLLQYVDGLEQAVNAKRVSFSFDVMSRAVEIPTCIMVMDVDRSGNPLNKTDTASGLLSELSEAGFDVFLLPVDYRMTAVSDIELIELVRSQYGNIYDRFIFGTAEISSFEESGTSVIVKVTGKIKAVELDSGRILFSGSEQKRARGGNNAATISAAFTSLGKMYGEKLVTDLP